MTRYSDNIYSGNTAATSAKASKSAVWLTRYHDFNSTTGSTTLSGVFPTGTKNLTGELFITNQGSATTSDKITVSAGGTTLLTIDQFGSASGIAFQTTAGLARFTVVASACADVPVPTSADNGGEIPYSVTYLKASANKTGSCRLVLNFNRADTSPDGF